MTKRPPFGDLESRILYEKDDILVVNKPHDIPTSGKSLDDDDALQYWLIERQGSMVWAVHQLDADTTGVNIFVTRKKLVGKLQKALAHPDSSKRYWAIVHGRPEWQETTCTEPIGKIDERSLGVHKNGKSAESHFTCLSGTGEFSLIEASIKTGRTHQIRIHLSFLGLPLVGEEWYRNPPCVKHPRQALHALEVALTGVEPGHFLAPLAQDFVELAHSLHLSLPHW